MRLTKANRGPKREGAQAARENTCGQRRHVQRTPVRELRKQAAFLVLRPQKNPGEGAYNSSALKKKKGPSPLKLPVRSAPFQCSAAFPSTAVFSMTNLYRPPSEPYRPRTKHAPRNKPSLLVGLYRFSYFEDSRKRTFPRLLRPFLSKLRLF